MSLNDWFLVVGATLLGWVWPYSFYRLNKGGVRMVSAIGWMLVALAAVV